MKKAQLILVGIVIVLILVVISVHYIPRIICKGTAWECERETLEPAVVQKGESKMDYYKYSGKNGRTAYDVLMRDESAWLGAEDEVLTTINFRKADVSKNERWVFYVNGQKVQEKPWDYVTKDSDIIELKIERH
jgi:hypothetical protein